MPTGCTAQSAITVNPLTANTGTTRVCVGQTTTLANATAGGTWSSSNVARATVGSATGVVTGVAAGTAVISYALASGCTAVSTVTVNPLSAITGTLAACTGLTTTLANATAGGTWSSTDATVASIGSLTGVVTGVSAGTATISYILSTGCSSLATVTVNPTAAITGSNSVCVLQSITLANAVAGGVWSSSATGVATIGSATGVVNGVALGTTIITYALPGNCNAVKAITVNALSAITGATSVCVGRTITLANSTAGGTWSSSSIGVATIGSTTGIVSGVAAGTTSITYTLASGCNIASTITVNPLSANTGATTVCVGQTITLANATAGGAWSSSAAGKATVGAGTGIVSGISAGTAVITYLLPTGCLSSTNVTINAMAAITGTTGLCGGQSATLANATAGGTWSTSDAAVATIGSTTGVVTGVASGTATISYTVGTGCVALTTVTTTSVAAIVGPSLVCVGQSMTLTNATAGGVWSSSNTLRATIGSATGVVTGISTGSFNATYTLGSCNLTSAVTVNALSPITGVTPLCVSMQIGLSDATAGGTWSSSAPAIATIGSITAIVTGVATGTATISYTVGSGCVATTTLSVSDFNPITGPTQVCTGTTITLSNASVGGTWGTGNVLIATVGSATGVVTGVLGGSTLISYTLGGCRATYSIGVTNLSAITGSSNVCVGQSTTYTISGTGTWSSSNTGAATVGSTTGLITGVAVGTAIISYTTPSGCSAVKTITVNALSNTAGPTSVCTGQTITLTNATAGGTWSSSNTTRATVDLNTGVVTGVLGGISTITYTVGAAACKATYPITINNLTAISGSSSVCATQSITLTSAAGVWSTSNPALATVGSATGVVTGVAAGNPTISITQANGCVATTALTVNAFSAITGASSVCISTPITLSNATAGGLWTSANPTVARVGSTTGLVTGVIASATRITYTIAATGCRTSVPMTVLSCRVSNGVQTLCVGAAKQFEAGTTDAIWHSADNTIATVDAVSGMVTAVRPGNTTIYTTDANGTETSSTPVTVYSLMNAVSISVNPGAHVKVGQNVTFNANTNNDIPVSGYQWLVNGQQVPGANAATFSTSGLNNGDVVNCDVISDCGILNAGAGITMSVGAGIGSLLSTDIKLLPNPNNGSFVIKGVLETGNDQEVSLEVVNMLGQVVYKGVCVATNGRINESVKLQSNIANGMYILNVNTAGGNNVYHFVIER